MSIKKNISEIEKNLNENVTLIAVSKYHTEEEIMEVYNLGLRDFGENKVQDMVKKMENLPKDIRWHLIGHLQTNKVKYIIGKTHLIHSVDSIDLAKEINKRSGKEGIVTDCLVQINSTGIEGRFGVDPENAESFLEELKEFKNIKIKGIMGMAPITDDATPYFTLLKNIFDDLKNNNLIDGDILSMGMSADYKTAVKCGSTMVRVGSALFR